MSNDLLVLTLLVVVVITGSALCSGVEAALLTVNPVQVHELAARPQPIAGARRLAQLRQRLGRTLSVLVIANNGFNIFGSLMLGAFAAYVFEKHNISDVALPLFSVSLTLLVIVLGEILPKSLGSRLAPATGRSRAASSCTRIGLTVSSAASTPEQRAEPSSTTKTSSNSTRRSELIAV